MSDFPFDITLDRIDENGGQPIDGKWWPDEIAARLIDPDDPKVRAQKKAIDALVIAARDMDSRGVTAALVRLGGTGFTLDEDEALREPNSTRPSDPASKSDAGSLGSDEPRKPTQGSAPREPSEPQAPREDTCS